VGAIWNTSLLNPEFGNLGPRLSPSSDLAVFSPDYLSEKVTLVAVVMRGSLEPGGAARQGVPALAASIDAQVRLLERDEIVAFHQAEGRLQLGYLPMLASLTSNPLAPLPEPAHRRAVGRSLPRRGLPLASRPITWPGRPASSRWLKEPS
jgi:hypothetical protein